MKVLYTKTSSQGNCSVIENGDGDLLVIDAGIQFDKVSSAIGYRLYNASAILLSHGHVDHIAYIKKFVECGIVCYGLQETLSASLEKASKRYSKPIEIKKTYSVKGFKFVPLEMKHTNSDGTNCPCCGYLIQDTATGEKMLWATDTQYIKQRFPKLDYIGIECNHFERDDWADSIGYVEKSVEKRRVESHMSFETAVKFLNMQDLSACKGIYLLHLSSTMQPNQKKRIAEKMKKELNQKGVNVYA